jgi:hypothetical protein
MIVPSQEIFQSNPIRCCRLCLLSRAHADRILSTYERFSSKPWSCRRRRLAANEALESNYRYAAGSFRHACKMGLEGIVSKRLGSRYRSGRLPDRLKLKNPAAPAVRREAEEDWGGERDHAQFGGHHSCGGYCHDIRAASRCACKKAETPRRRPDATAPSLDGRTLGRMRTCGFDYLQYDGLGTPYGPYCP